LCHRVPDNVSLEEAVMIEPAATVVRGIERARIKPGARVAIIGCGPIGQITARVLSLNVPTMILGIDVSETQRSVALRSGMTQFVTTQNQEELRQLSKGEGWDVVVNCATGSAPLGLAFAIARRGASIVIFGTTPDKHCFTIPANRLVMGDLQVEGVLGYTAQSWTRTLRLLEKGELKFHDLITHRVSLADFGRAIQLIETKMEPMGKVAVSYNGAAGPPVRTLERFDAREGDSSQLRKLFQNASIVRDRIGP
jgi:threonine dehydrogenase-like Zn-dependent dehydrogenase